MFDLIKNISPTEIAIVILILVVLFGRKAVIGLGKTSGETVREIKKIKREFTRVIDIDDNKPSKK